YDEEYDDWFLNEIGLPHYTSDFDWQEFVGARGAVLFDKIQEDKANPKCNHLNLSCSSVHFISP
ncbi:MAG: hypothetical protein GY928_23290, partial [Colwellia sp.]|nr:hypothetical protein [Colwellia sp.]